MEKKKYEQPQLRVYAIRPNAILASSLAVQSSGVTIEQYTKGDNSLLDDVWNEDN